MLRNVNCPRHGAQTRPLVKFPLCVRSRLVNIMQEQLSSKLAVERFAPMRTFYPPVNHRIPGFQCCASCAHRAFDPQRPDSRGAVSQIDAHTKLAGWPIGVPFKAISSRIDTEVRIGRKKRALSDLFDLRKKALEKAFHVEIATPRKWAECRVWRHCLKRLGKIERALAQPCPVLRRHQLFDESKTVGGKFLKVLVGNRCRRRRFVFDGRRGFLVSHLRIVSADALRHAAANATDPPQAALRASERADRRLRVQGETPIQQVGGLFPVPLCALVVVQHRDH